MTRSLFVLPKQLLSNRNYRPQTKLRKGNVFTSVCQEFCLRGSASVHAGIHPPTHPAGQTPPHPGQTPPSRRLLQRMVRILLECILISYQFSLNSSNPKAEIKVCSFGRYERRCRITHRSVPLS